MRYTTKSRKSNVRNKIQCAPTVVSDTSVQTPKINRISFILGPLGSKQIDRFSWIFIDFPKFSLRRSKWLKISKNKVYLFCLFTPLYRHFRFSRVSHVQDLDEIYRLVSKILDVMPCGSVFGRFCALDG